MKDKMPMFVPIPRPALALGLFVLAAAAPALPVQAATQEEFLAACLEVAGEDNIDLCTCKAEQAAQLVDAEMMDFIIIRMKDPAAFSEMVKAGDVPGKVIAKWPFYVRDSNGVCLAPDSEEG